MRVKEKKEISAKVKTRIAEISENRKDMATTLGITCEIDAKIDPKGCLTRKIKTLSGKRSVHSKELSNLRPVVSLHMLDGIDISQDNAGSIMFDSSFSASSTASLLKDTTQSLQKRPSKRYSTGIPRLTLNGDSCDSSALNLPSKNFAHSSSNSLLNSKSRFSFSFNQQRLSYVQLPEPKHNHQRASIMNQTISKPSHWPTKVKRGNVLQITNSQEELMLPEIVVSTHLDNTDTILTTKVGSHYNPRVVLPSLNQI